MTAEIRKYMRLVEAAEPDYDDFLRALAVYTHSAGYRALSAAEQAQVDAAFAVHMPVLDRSLTVYRGLRFNSFDDLIAFNFRDLDVLQDISYISASTTPGVADLYRFDSLSRARRRHSALLTIRTMPGARGIVVADYDDDYWNLALDDLAAKIDDMDGSDDEDDPPDLDDVSSIRPLDGNDEIILAKGARFRVAARKMVNEWADGSDWEAELEQIA